MAYKVLVGVDYPPDRRAEPGDIVDDLPPKSVKWLLDQGIVEQVDGKGKPSKPTATEPAVEPEPADPEES